MQERRSILLALLETKRNVDVFLHARVPVFTHASDWQRPLRQVLLAETSMYAGRCRPSTGLPVAGKCSWDWQWQPLRWSPDDPIHHGEPRRPARCQEVTCQWHFRGRGDSFSRDFCFSSARDFSGWSSSPHCRDFVEHW